MNKDLQVKKESEKIQLLSDEINEVFGVPPHWIIRWGTIVVLTIICTVFIGSIFIRYPDLVYASATLTYENPPSSITAKANGKLESIFFPDGAHVDRNDTLAVIESSANFEHIFYLSKLMMSYNPENTTKDIFCERDKIDSMVLGDIQSPFNAFFNSHNKMRLFLQQETYRKKITGLRAELKQNQQSYRILKSKFDLGNHDLMISQLQFSRDSQLFQTNTIPEAELERSKTVLIAKKQGNNDIRLAISNTAITITQLEQNIQNLEFDEEIERKKLHDDLLATCTQLVSDISSWSKIYVLKSPSAGRISYMTKWSDLQEVRSGNQIFTIIPDDLGKMQVRILIPFEGVGKVREGQRVNIKLDAYPYLEFGMIEGVVESISAGSEERKFPALVQLPKGEITTYGYKLRVEKELSGIGEIITIDQSIFMRLLAPARHLSKNIIINNIDQQKIIF